MLYLFACSAPSSWEYLHEDQYILANTHANMIRQIDFFGTDDQGQAWGFNLDDRDSPEGEEESCEHGDLTDATGRTGIDNQMATIWDLIEPVAGSYAQEVLLASFSRCTRAHRRRRST